MAISPLCLVQDGAGSFVPTTNGVNLTPGNTISVKLVDPTGVAEWYLEVTGTDELSTNPSLTNVDPVTRKVLTPSAVVSFTMPAANGRSILFTTTVLGGSGQFQTTFSLYTLTDQGLRVASVGETTEGNSTFGWATAVNPIIRSGASVLRYDDTTQPPASGAGTIQGALDWLKTQVGGGGAGAFYASLFGEYSAADTPGFIDAPYYIDTDKTLDRVVLVRRKSGGSGETRIDVWLNGTSIYGGNPVLMPKVLAGADYAVATDMPGVSLTSGALLEIRLDAAEGFLSGPTPQEDGPEGLFVILLFA